MSNETGKTIARISDWIDNSESYRGLDPETHLWRRVSKAGAEFGEVLDAMSGMLGENPRKGVTHARSDVVNELLDVAVAALGAVEHMTGNRGDSEELLHVKIKFVAHRAGLDD